MLKKLLPAICCSALAAGCASTGSVGAADPVPGKAAELAGHAYMWTDGSSEDCELPPSIRFGADGRISGQAGCNRILGGWKLDGKALQLGEVATTMRLCAPQFMEVEKKFLGFLADTRFVTQTADGKGIDLWNEKGEKIVSLVPERPGKCD